MRRIALTLAAAALVAACGSDDHSGPSAGLPQGSDAVKLNPADFSTDIDNRFWPMKPGTRWVYREIDGQGGVQRVVVTVTPVSKKLADGVTARLVRDTATEGTQLVEDTIDLYAQHKDGTLWYMGEQTAEFEGGKVKSRAGSWETGIRGAQPGVAMPADPRDDMRYRQEYLRGQAEDQGEVMGTGQMVQVPAGRYRDAVLTRDTSPLEPTVVEYKLYAPGIGPALTLDASGESGREELLSVEHVDLRSARAAGTAPLGVRYP